MTKKKLTSELGMSLVEVMIAAGLLGAIAYMGMNLFEQQSRQARDVTTRFEMQDLMTQMSRLLSDSGSCKASFAEIPFKSGQTLEGPTFLSEVIGKDGDKNLTKDRYFTKNADPSKKYGNNTLQIDRYELSNNNDTEVGVDEKTGTGTYYLNIYFDRGDKVVGSHILLKSLLLNIELDSDKKTIANCYTSGGMGGGGKASKLVILDPTVDTSLANLTGIEACNRRGLECVTVHSLNFVFESFGDPSLGQICPTVYNQKLPGIKEAVPKSPWHQCDAKLGVFKTFESITTGGKGNIQCQAVFTAFCQ